MFSAAPYRYPARSMRCHGVPPLREEWDSRLVAAISAECCRAARTRRGSTCSGGHPTRRRSRLTSRTTAFSIEERLGVRPVPPSMLPGVSRPAGPPPEEPSIVLAGRRLTPELGGAVRRVVVLGSAEESTGT